MPGPRGRLILRRYLRVSMARLTMSERAVKACPCVGTQVHDCVLAQDFRKPTVERFRMRCLFWHLWDMLKTLKISAYRRGPEVIARRSKRRFCPDSDIASGQGASPDQGELGLFRRRSGRMGPRCCAQHALYMAMAVCLQPDCACARIVSAGRLARAMDPSSSR